MNPAKIGLEPYMSRHDTELELSETRRRDMDPKLADAIRTLQRDDTGLGGYCPFSDMSPEYGWLRLSYVRQALDLLDRDDIIHFTD